MVYENGARPHPGKGAVFSEGHGAKIVVIADTAKYEISALSGVARRRSCAGWEHLHEFLRFCGRPVVNGHCAAGSREMAGDRKSHHAQSDEGDVAAGWHGGVRVGREEKAVSRLSCSCGGRRRAR